MRAKAWLKTDGSDFHVKPESDKRRRLGSGEYVGEDRPCSICGFPSESGWPHRKHPKGGWETIEGYHDGPGVRHWVPPVVVFEESAATPESLS
jgi:hypothetical protein